MKTYFSKALLFQSSRAFTWSGLRPHDIAKEVPPLRNEWHEIEWLSNPAWVNNNLTREAKFAWVRVLTCDPDLYEKRVLSGNILFNDKWLTSALTGHRVRTEQLVNGIFKTRWPNWIVLLCLIEIQNALSDIIEMSFTQMSSDKLVLSYFNSNVDFQKNP